MAGQRGKRGSNEELEIPAPKRLLLQWYRPGWIVVASFLGLCILFWNKLEKFLPDLSKSPRYQITHQNIRINDPPHWVPIDLKQQVLSRSELPDSFSILDTGLADKLSQAFQTHPWIKEVESVRILSSGVEVQVVYRRPVALIVTPSGEFPVDAEGVLLPIDDFSNSDKGRYPQVEKIVSDPPESPGTVWKDPFVREAAKLALALLPHWEEFQLTSIEVPNRGSPRSNRIFHLRSKGGSRIIWGRGVDDNLPGELTTEQKIGRLIACIERFGGFDQPNGPYTIDIRDWEEIIREPMARGLSPEVRE